MGEIVNCATREDNRKHKGLWVGGSFPVFAG